MHTPILFKLLTLPYSTLRSHHSRCFAHRPHFLRAARVWQGFLASASSLHPLNASATGTDEMATPFLTGLGIAGAAWAARAGLVAAERIASNPEYAKQAAAAAAGVKGMGDVFKRIPTSFGMGRFFMSESATGFNATMNRAEAAKILGIREVSNKQTVKEAHRKLMLLNHPDRGGSPFLASKINEASEVLQGQRRSSGSAFS